MNLLSGILFRVTAAAIICAVLRGLPLSGSIKKLMQILCGIFMLLTVFSVHEAGSLDGCGDILGNVSQQAQDIVQNSKEDTLEQMRKIIIAETEAYILDKAKNYGAELSVEVSVNDSDLPVPCGVTIRGSVSPYARRQLQQIIADDLGIETGEQEWVG